MRFLGLRKRHKHTSICAVSASHKFILNGMLKSQNSAETRRKRWYSNAPEVPEHGRFQLLNRRPYLNPTSKSSTKSCCFQTPRHVWFESMTQAPVFRRLLLFCCCFVCAFEVVLILSWSQCLLIATTTKLAMTQAMSTSGLRRTSIPRVCYCFYNLLMKVAVNPAQEGICLLSALEILTPPSVDILWQSSIFTRGLHASHVVACANQQKEK